MGSVRCAIIRGGTSKGIFFHEKDLPQEQKERERVILNVFGSPDKRQIDGLAGADVLTSKVAIIGISTRPDADVEYTFGQVMIERPEISWHLNCGNLSAAVGPFAIDEGLVKAVEPLTVVRIHNTNLDQIIDATVPVKNNKFNPIGDYKIDGVPGTGSKILLDYSKPAEGDTSKLLPTGQVKETLDVEGLGKIPVSIVGVGNLRVFAFAKDIGLEGTEEIKDIMANQRILENAEKIRGIVAQRLGFVKDPRDASTLSPTRPLSAFVFPPMDYVNHVSGDTIRAEDIDLRSIAFLAGRVHQAYPVGGTISTGAAAKTRGTVVYEVLSERGRQGASIRIGHPAGIIELRAKVVEKDNGFCLEEASLFRTARRIMEGFVYLKEGFTI
ncbi:MAG: PrpF domain-containing protein [Thermodesulfobacteriota bacterium]|nr:PrpF domain-containing protein [Thermodesulfobacteriota bacterium]